MKNIFKLSLVLACSAFSASAYADKVKLLEQDAEAAQARIELIKNAKQEILVEYYEVANDQLSKTGIALLKEAAQRGVKVKILIDSLHNSLTSAEMAVLLGVTDNSASAKNIEIKVFNPFSLLNPFHMTYRNHDKLLDVDGNGDNPMMIVGGRNVSEQYFGRSETHNFKDADTLVMGKSAHTAYKYFNDLWTTNPEIKKVRLNGYTQFNLNRHCFPDEQITCEKEKAKIRADIANAQNNIAQHMTELTDGLAWVKVGSIEEMLSDVEDVGEVQFAFNAPDKKMKKVVHKLARQVMDALENAKESITVVTPYLYPTEEELTALEKIMSTGNIKLRLITNSLASNDEVLVHAGLMSIKNRLAAMGAELYLYKGPKTLHHKGAIIDNKVSLIGSFNFDRRSAKINREIGVRIGSFDPAVKAPQFTTQYENFIDSEIISNSVLVTKDGKDVPGAMEAVDALATDAQKKSLAIQDGIILKLLKNQI